jgi:hypothetical protein
MGGICLGRFRAVSLPSPCPQCGYALQARPRAAAVPLARPSSLNVTQRLTFKLGRPCTICRHPKRARIEAAVTAGTSLRMIRKSYGVSPPALMRHRDNHMPREDNRAKARPAVAALSPPVGRTVAQDLHGNIIIDGCGRVTYVDGTGGSSSSSSAGAIGQYQPTLGGSVGTARASAQQHPPRWMSQSLAPRQGARCAQCGGSSWWWQGSGGGWGGCVKCWTPMIEGRKSYFGT